MKIALVLWAILATAFFSVPAHDARATHETPKSEVPSRKPEQEKSSSPSDAGSTSPAVTETVTTPAGAGPAAPPAVLNIASWGGAYMESQRRAFFTPFREATGIAIKAVNHSGALRDLAGKKPSVAQDWDLVDLEPAVLERACAQGMLVKLSPSDLAKAADGTPAADDFLPGMLHECGIPSVAWSSAIVFDTRAFKGARPTSAKDFFDTKRFPGKRALPRGPKYVFELALMADGVEPDDVYGELATHEGASRALKILDSLGENIIWWNRGHEPLEALSSGEATMALAFNGRIFSAIVAQNKPFALIWDGQVFDLDMWAIPKTTPHKASALKFIAFATSPERLAAQARWFPYGPVRKSALMLIGKHPEVGANMSDFIPTSPTNFKRALRMNASWWEKHGAEMKRRLKVWHTGEGGSAQTGADTEQENALR